MTPTNAIECFERGPMAEINRYRAHITDEAGDILEQWEGLGRAGGQRDDHAVQLLIRLRPRPTGRTVTRDQI